MNTPLSPKQIEYWPLAQLKPYALNAKTHDANQVAKIAASMAEFGWTVPVLVAADDELIAGHGRILAAAHLGLSEAPVRGSVQWRSAVLSAWVKFVLAAHAGRQEDRKEAVGHWCELLGTQISTLLPLVLQRMCVSSVNSTATKTGFAGESGLS
jgi:hypothetical protein